MGKIDNNMINMHEQIKRENQGKFVKVIKIFHQKWCGFHATNSVTGMCKTKKECIQDAIEMGYSITSSNKKANQ